MTQKANIYDVEKLICGSNKDIPAAYIRKALQDGKNIAIIGADIKERALFSISVLSCLPDADILLPDTSSPGAVLECFPDRKVKLADFKEKNCGLERGILYIDEAECRNMRKTLPDMLLYYYENGIRRQTISAFGADNNKQAIAKISRMLNQDSGKYDYKQCNRIVCSLLCEVCVQVKVDGKSIIISEIWENRAEALNDVKQEMVILYTEHGYFQFPEDADIFKN